MSSVVMERDLQEIEELTLRLERGTDLSTEGLLNRLHGVCSRVSAWQWCIHGDTTDFRRQVISWLVGKGRYVLAKRYALCGKGDLLCRHDVTGKARVRPMGCGARFCPRCSRRSGRKHLSRVASHLSSSPHGSIWHIVLTQPQVGWESIQNAKERFEKSWKAFYPTLRKAGLKAALATYHVKPSRRFGWHYHCHLVVEWDDAVDSESLYERLNGRWKAACSQGRACSDNKELFVRIVTDGGPALVGMSENTQLDFWDEPQDAVEKCLHYVLRDVLQGIESWIESMKDPQDCVDFCNYMGTSKRHRSYGTWRKAVPGNVTEERDREEERTSESEALAAAGIKKGSSEWTAMGTMDMCVGTSKTGSTSSRELLMQLIGSTNRSRGVLWRLRKVVQRLCA